MKKILLLGPKYSRSGEIGGIVVAFELMCEVFKNANIETTIIDLNKGNYLHKLSAFISIYTKTLLSLPFSSTVVLNGTVNDFKYIAPMVVFFSKIFNKKIILRKFAGSFIEEYERSSFINKKMMDYALIHSSVNFFETKYLVSYLKKYNKNTVWLPNSRVKPLISRELERPYLKKIIYLGHIREEKGIYDLIELSKKIDASYCIDLYGAIIEEELEELIENSLLHYRGELLPDDVISTLCNYDILILPSYREGYPGVIIEALSVGLPIVATKLESISEIVDAQCGILFEPKNVEAMKSAIELFSVDNYCSYSTNALKQFQLFDSHIVTQKLIEKL